MIRSAANLTGGSQQDRAALRQAKQIRAARDKAHAALQAMGDRRGVKRRRPASGAAGGGASGSASPAERLEALQREYVATLGPLTFGQASLIGRSYFRKDLGKSLGAEHERKRTRHIVMETATLQSALPCHWASTVAVRVDDSRMDVLQALVVGPDDTPCAQRRRQLPRLTSMLPSAQPAEPSTPLTPRAPAPRAPVPTDQNGIFIFDIVLPSDYPSRRARQRRSPRSCRLAAPRLSLRYLRRTPNCAARQAADGAAPHDGPGEGPVQPEPLRVRQGLPLAAGDVAGARLGPDAQHPPRGAAPAALRRRNNARSECFRTSLSLCLHWSLALSTNGSATRHIRRC